MNNLDIMSEVKLIQDFNLEHFVSNLLTWRDTLIEDDIEDSVTYSAIDVVIDYIFNN